MRLHKSICKKNIFVLVVLIALIIIPEVLAASWDMQLTSHIVSNDFNSNGLFFLGAKNTAQDGIDAHDGRMMESPSYATPFFSEVSNEQLMIDYRENLLVGTPKKWDIVQKGSMEFTWLTEFKEEITWDISNVPSAITIHLIDYGTDSSRSTPLVEIDLRSEPSYSFTSKLSGKYRYYSIVATATENICSESWSCNSWEECESNGIQTRTCIDSNNCGTTNEKPQIIQTCVNTCEESWQCNAWTPSVCPISGIQTQSCVDSNNCGTSNSQPSGIKTCQYIPNNQPLENNTNASAPIVQTNNEPIIIPQSSSSSTRKSHSSNSHSIIDCTPEWTCDEWEECKESRQERFCYDIKNCNIERNRPIEMQSCTKVKKEILQQSNSISTKSTIIQPEVIQTQKPVEIQTLPVVTSNNEPEIIILLMLCILLSLLLILVLLLALAAIKKKQRTR